MLIFISDLHYRDDDVFTVPVEATKGFITKNLVPMIRDANAKDVTVVFLGDIVDINRSKYWVNGQSQKNNNSLYFYKPWSNWKEALRTIPGKSVGDDPDFDSEEFTQHVLNVLKEIRNVNGQNYKLWQDFKKGKKSLWGSSSAKVPPITYRFIPGNHDRLAQYSPKTRQALIEDLSLDGGATSKFPWIEYYKEYSVLAFHGHVLTSTDFGCDTVPDDPENSPWYDVPAFGDVATLNFGVGIVQDFLKTAAGAKNPELAATLGEIDLVRPQSGALRWLSKWGFQQPSLKGELDRIVVNAFNAMMQDEFAKWRMNLGWIEKAYLSLKTLETVEDVMSIVEKQASGPATVEEYNKSMVQALGQPTVADWLFKKQWLRPNIVSGHTHQPGVIPLQGETGANVKDEMVYFNTGTWLPVIEAAAMKGFARRNKIVHVTFYKDGEDEDRKRNIRSYWEYWEGNLREGPISTPT